MAKQARPKAKAAPKAKLTVRKVAVKDLSIKRSGDVAGGSYSVIQRCR